MERAARVLLICFVVPLLCNSRPANDTPGEVAAYNLLHECVNESGVDHVQAQQLEDLFGRNGNLSAEQLIELMKPILGPERHDLYILCFVSHYLKATIDCADEVYMTTFEKDLLRGSHDNLYGAMTENRAFPQLLDKVLGKERADLFKNCKIMATLFSEEV